MRQLVRVVRLSRLSAVGNKVKCFHGHQTNENINKMCTFTNNAPRSPTYVCILIRKATFTFLINFRIVCEIQGCFYSS
jgi:hypothetical protein